MKPPLPLARLLVRRGVQLSILGTAVLLSAVGACSDEAGSKAAAPKVAEAPPQCGAVPAALSVRVCGRYLVDSHGDAVQLRGVNVSGLEAVAIFGWSPANPWGAQTGDPTPNWKTIQSWGVNAVRLPLNEASWLGLRCIDEGGIGVVVANGSKHPNAPGTQIQADPGANYQSTVAASVAGATAAGLYVIIDLHLSAPGNACPTVQNAMADADHSIAFWTSVASAFRSYPNVVFELFNEPFLDQAPLVDDDAWTVLLKGDGTVRTHLAQGNPSVIDQPWRTAGMQQMLDAVRATGARNVVLTSTLVYAQAMDGWLDHKPVDPANQLAAVWHAYPAIGYPTQASCWGPPRCSARMMDSVLAVQAAGYPVLITEFGDFIGGSTAPWASKLLPFADAHGIGYLAWTWDTWSGHPANVLITDAAGTPTAGYGSYVRAHYLCRAAGKPDCP